MLSLRICMGCKNLKSAPHINEKGLADGGDIWCELDKYDFLNKCKLCNNGVDAWGSKFEYEEE